MVLTAFLATSIVMPEPRNPTGDRSSATSPSSRCCVKTMSLPRAFASRWANTTALIARSVNRSNTALTGLDRALRCCWRWRWGLAGEKTGRKELPWRRGCARGIRPWCVVVERNTDNEHFRGITRRLNWRRSVNDLTVHGEAEELQHASIDFRFCRLIEREKNDR